MKPVSCHHPPQWTRGLRDVSLQPDREGAAYIRTRSQDDDHYMKLVTDFLEKFDNANRKEINDLLLSKLSDMLSDDEKLKKVSNLLTKMRIGGFIKNNGTRSRPIWTLSSSEKQE